jgi:hypothetical protein
VDLAPVLIGNLSHGQYSFEWLRGAPQPFRRSHYCGSCTRENCHQRLALSMKIPIKTGTRTCGKRGYIAP